MDCIVEIRPLAAREVLHKQGALAEQVRFQHSMEIDACINLILIPQLMLACAVQRARRFWDLIFNMHAALHTASAAPWLGNVFTEMIPPVHMCGQLHTGSCGDAPVAGVAFSLVCRSPAG
jgi:hypothetical protein